jgi:hypothetical protein
MPTKQCLREREGAFTAVNITVEEKNTGAASEFITLGEWWDARIKNVKKGNPDAQGDHMRPHLFEVGGNLMRSARESCGMKCREK